MEFRHYSKILKLKVFQIFPLLDATAAQEAHLSMFQHHIDKCNVSNSIRIKENYTQQISKKIFHKPNCVKHITQRKSNKPNFTKQSSQNIMPKRKLHKAILTKQIAQTTLHAIYFTKQIALNNCRKQYLNIAKLSVAGWF